MNTRKEHDFLGDLEIPDDLYYGVQTYRAKQNFNITGITISNQPLFIKAFAYVKKAAALANRDCKVLDPKICDAIVYACDRIIAGEFLDQFVSDMLQGGAGTSTNMNLNEVIANIGLEYLGCNKGDYKNLHPNNHVNFSQSTNDAYPTALHIALYMKIEELIAAQELLVASLHKKGKEFVNVLKMGRTQLQDAVPMSLGMEFTAMGNNLKEDIAAMREVQSHCCDTNMGATAIGTGINAPEGYAELVTNYLRQITGIPVVLEHDLIEATVDVGAYVQISGGLKRCSIKLSKVCNDLRLLASGPRCGFNEINLPSMQPGSSIMPGKVNPVIPEVVNQVCYYVMGADVTVGFAAEAGQLQLNVMEPVIAFSLFTSLEYLTNSMKTLKELCIDGITANEEVTKKMVMNSIGIVTSLNPIIGYEASADIARECLKSGKSVHQIAVEEKKLVTQEKWDEIYSFENLINPKFINS